MITTSLTRDPALLSNIDLEIRAFLKDTAQRPTNVSKWVHPIGDHYSISIYLRRHIFDIHQQKLEAPTLVISNIENLFANSGGLLPAQFRDEETSEFGGQAHGLGIFGTIRATAEALLAAGDIHEIQFETVRNVFLAPSLARHEYRCLDGSWAITAATAEKPPT